MKNLRVLEMLNEQHTDYLKFCNYVVVRDGLLIIVPTKTMARNTYKKMRKLDNEILKNGQVPPLIDVKKYEGVYNTKLLVNRSGFYSNYACRLTSYDYDGNVKNAKVDSSVLIIAKSKKGLQYGLTVMADQMNRSEISIISGSKSLGRSVYIDMAIGDKRLISPMHINYVNQDQAGVSCGIVDNLEDTKNILESM